MKNSNLPDELMDKIKQQSIKNVVDKVKAGKIPTRAEWALLEEARAVGEEVPVKLTGVPKHTKSRAKLRNYIIDRHGISERKAYDWVNKLKHMYTSKGWPVPEILMEIADRKQQATGSPLTDLKREKLQEEVLILRQRRMSDAGELVSIDEHRAALAEVCAAVRGAGENVCQRVAAETRDAERLAVAEDLRDEMLNGIRALV